jgi:alpha-glucosidase
MRARFAAVFLVFALASSAGLHAADATHHEVRSPDGELTIAIDAGDKLTYSVLFDEETLIASSPISMTLSDGRVLGGGAHVEDATTRSQDTILHPVVRVKSAAIRDRFHELTVDFGDWDLVVRAYDGAAAYRFRTRLDGEIVVADEQVTFAFAADHHVYYPLEEGFVSHNERAYQHRRLSNISAEDLASLPALVDVDGGPKVLIAESDLRSYPGLWLRGTGGPALQGDLPRFVLEEHMSRDRDPVVDRRADFLARTQGTRSFPWRVLVVAKRDADLLEDQTVYKLGGELELDDTSWIRPGKVAWDWYNANNLFGVDFRAGVNTRTYEHYIDFAAKYGIEYVILDEGWYVLGDLMTTTPEMDVPHLFAYAAERGVSIIPWVVWKTLDEQLDEALDQFQRWGAAGIKVDFMQRDDQWMVDYYERIARAAAKRHLLVDFHGAYKPAGLDRRYPNVITREGVKGLENNKWSEEVTPEHDVTLPFVRMVAGPMDFTPGAMVNAQKDNFRAVFYRPMSQGTRCHQLAMYVVYDSPLQMLADSPSQYLREPEAMELLGPVPAVWDRTIGLDATVGDYVVMARRSGEDWYVGAMTDWDPRELDVDLAFLPEGSYRMEVWRDGVNADRYASDFARESRTVSRQDRLRIAMAPGGGWVARLTREERPEAVTFSWFEYQGKDEIFAEPLPEGTFQNPILAGFYPDPSIVRAGDEYYMVHSSFAYFPGVPLFRSTDLVNWEPIGHVLTRPSQLRVSRAGVSRGIFAPTLRYHDGVFYMITTGIDGAGGNFIVTATDPAGEWSEPFFLPEIDGIDPSLFFDDDGRVWLVHNGPPEGEPLYDGHRAIWLWELDLEAMRVVEGSRRRIVDGGVDLSRKPIWIEAPHIYRVGDWYYLFCAEGGTGPQHSEVVFRSRSLDEPFMPYDKNPILTQRDLDPARPDPIATTGHADVVQTPAGEWWAVFLGTRNYDRDDFNTGRETFLLPMTWKDGWPTILPPGTVLPYRLPAPKGLRPTAGAVPLTGNFTWRDDFTSAALGPLWNLLRTPEDPVYELHPGGGISLFPRPVAMDGDTQPAFLGRRQQHQTFSAATEVELPSTAGVTAGLVAFQSELHHYFLGVEKRGDGHLVVLERAAGSPPVEIARSPVEPAASLILEIEGDRDRISFYVRLPGAAERTTVAEDLDARILSTREAGGFVGTYLGMHARGRR